MESYRITIENIRGDEVRDKPYGSGTEYSPYKISSAENLVYVAEHPEMWDGNYFLQTNNIDMSGYEFTPIGYNGNFSLGSVINYNGNGYFISNILNSTLFGHLKNSVIKNLIIKNFIINANMRGVVFKSIGDTILENISIIDSEIHSEYLELGIFTGTCYPGNHINNIIIDNCIIECTYAGSYNTIVGGAFGSIYQEQQENSIRNVVVKNSTITGGSTIGGVIGYIEDGHIIIDGVASINNTINSNSYYNPTNPFHQYQAVNIGGIVGMGSVKNSYSANNIITIDRNLTSILNAGGISGLMNNNIDDCLLNCWSNSTIVNNVSVDEINIGAICGYLSNISTSIDLSYWDEAVSGINIDCGFNNTGTSATSITTAQLAQQSTFTDWDFTDIWEMGTNYPVLQFESLVTEKETEFFEYTFEYPILKGTTKYDPMEYISYDYMISTARTAQFQALIEDYFDTETFDFVNSIMRVGYKDYDNDITLYNHFYYSTEDDEDEFVRIELEDNTIKYEIGTTITDKYGENRVVSSREIITEGISTLMCRIYELHDNNEEVLVYSGLIDKRETKFDGKKLSVKLIDMMGLYAELAEKHNITVIDFQDNGFDFVDTQAKIKQFILFIKNNININNKYILGDNGININYSENNDAQVDWQPLFYNEHDININAEYVLGGILFFAYIDFTFDEAGNILLNLRDTSFISSMDSISLNKENAGSDSLTFIDLSNIKLPIYKFNDENNLLGAFGAGYIVNQIITNDMRFNPAMFNMVCMYDTDQNNLYMYPNMGVYLRDGNSGGSSFCSNMAFSIPIYETAKPWLDNQPIDFSKYAIFEKMTDFDTSGMNSSNMHIYAKELIDLSKDVIDNKIKILQDDFNSVCILNKLAYVKTDNSYDDFEVDFLSHYDNPYIDPLTGVSKYLLKICSFSNITNNELFISSSNNEMTAMVKKIYSNTYASSIPLYSNNYSLYDITKLFSLSCYNRIYTTNDGVLVFDKENYDVNGYTYIQKDDIINSYKQEAMIGSDEEFNILDDVYVGTKYIKEAYKRLETSTRETYKTLYENNNMKISFELMNYDYDFYKKGTIGIYETRKIQPKDTIHIKDDGSIKISVFVTSIKYANAGSVIKVEGITLSQRTITT